jgi:hypothetical protein
MLYIFRLQKGGSKVNPPPKTSNAPNGRSLPGMWPPTGTATEMLSDLTGSILFFFLRNRVVFHL